MCLEIVERAVGMSGIMQQLAIRHCTGIMSSPKVSAAAIPSLRADGFRLVRQGRTKLLEYNADTPTSLYESSTTFNGYGWRMPVVAAPSRVMPSNWRYGAADRPLQRLLYSRSTAVVKIPTKDRTTVLYLQDCAQQAGETRFIYIEELGLGVGDCADDLDDNVIRRAFKALPAGVDDARRQRPAVAKTS